MTGHSSSPSARRATAQGWPPRLRHPCKDCKEIHEPFPIRELVVAAELEHTVITEQGSVRFDVALFGRQGLLFGIEIRDTHPVSVEKRGLLYDAGLRWVEVSVDQVLEDNASFIRPLAGGGPTGDRVGP